MARVVEKAQSGGDVKKRAFSVSVVAAGSRISRRSLKPQMKLKEEEEEEN